MIAYKNKKNSDMKMSEPLFPLSPAKIGFYLIRAKFIRMLCNMFKQNLLIN